ncbi:7388_t:CDS:2, partial [Diversispora eburnea]
NSTKEIKSRIDQIWVSDNLVDQLFCADIIPSDLESHTENITFGNDNIEEKSNFFRNVIIGKANEIIPKKKKLISG